MRSFRGSAKLKGKDKKWCWAGNSLTLCSRFQCEDELGWAEGHRTCALLVTDGVLVLHVVLVLLAAQVQLVQVKRVAEECIIMGKLVPSNNLLGNCAITFAEVFSLLCKNEKQLEIALSSSKYCVLLLICFAVNFAHNFQHFTNHG